jgi:signal transduction histidine kinase
MKPKNDQFVDLESRIKNVVNELLGATPINYTVTIAPGINQLMLNPLAKKNLMLMVKEAVNNCAKYSHAQHFELSLTNIEGLELRMADDGVGFDSTKTPATGGNGLKNIAKRVAELSGKVEINSSHNGGTIITIYLPIVTIRGDAFE